MALLQRRSSASSAATMEQVVVSCRIKGNTAGAAHSGQPQQQRHGKQTKAATKSTIAFNTRQGQLWDGMAGEGGVSGVVQGGGGSGGSGGSQAACTLPPQARCAAPRRPWSRACV